MLNHTSIVKFGGVDESDAASAAFPVSRRDARSAGGELDDIRGLARCAGMLITLDAQIGREKYQNVMRWRSRRRSRTTDQEEPS